MQQLNIVRPPVDHEYVAVAGELLFNDLAWQEGFADYRTQAQSKGAMVELVTLSYQLLSPARFAIERDGPGVERLRLALFDFGLQFSCKEFKTRTSSITSSAQNSRSTARSMSAHAGPQRGELSGLIAL